MHLFDIFRRKNVCTPARMALCAGVLSTALGASACAQPNDTAGQLAVSQANSAKVSSEVPAFLEKYVGTSQGVRLEDGVIVYRHGKTMPFLLCQPLRVCDIQLQAGEKVSAVVSGDDDRWELTKVTQGKTPHIVVKPLIDADAPDTTTNILIFTNKRTYSVVLKSSQVASMQGIRFEYAKSAVAKKAASHSRKRSRGKRPSSPPNLG